MNIPNHPEDFGFDVIESHSDGAHLVLSGYDEIIDYWPNTEHWKIRTGESGYYLKYLYSELN